MKLEEAVRKYQGNAACVGESWSKQGNGDNLKGEEKSSNSREQKLRDKGAGLGTDMAGGWLGWLLYFGQAKAYG